MDITDVMCEKRKLFVFSNQSRLYETRKNTFKIKVSMWLVTGGLIIHDIVPNMEITQ